MPEPVTAFVTLALYAHLIGKAATQRGFMDFATMFVVLLFTGGDAEHFIQGQRSMSACQRTVTSQKNGEQTSGSVETDYVISRVCLPVSPKLFAGITSHSGRHRSSPCAEQHL
jgi:hypothetical protein